MYNHAIDI